MYAINMNKDYLFSVYLNSLKGYFEQKINFDPYFLSSGSELLGVVMSVGLSVCRSLENLDNF